jgi:molecular chaperone GrpE
MVRVMSDQKESAADKAIREALESVERLERERKTAAGSGADGEVAFAPDDADAGAAFQSTPPAPAEPASDAPKKKTADQMMVESLLKAKGELQNVLEQTQKEAKDMFERLARVSADFENFKKRVGREKDEAIKFGNEKAFKEILPVVDNFRRALLVAPPDGGQFVEGIRLVSKSLEDALGRFGVVGFDSLGEPFDPAKHEAVGSRPHETIPSQHVCEEYQRGYLLHDRLLRPALVIVSSGPAN